MGATSSICISVADLWTYRVADSGGTEREPLSRLGELRNGRHVHGRLTVEIHGRTVPHLGFSGPDDVCMNVWLVELCSAANALAGTTGAHTFDEGEQGQPSFTFVRSGDDVVFSIEDSVLGDGPADPDWQDVRFPYVDYLAAVVRLLDALRAELQRHVPETWQRWWPPEARVLTA